MFQFQLDRIPEKSCEKVLLAMILSLVFMESEASAYLDPGTGSFVLQIIAASIVAVAFFVRKFWSKITSLFTHKQPNSANGKDQ